jgi:hypothetical protein
MSGPGPDRVHGAACAPRSLLDTPACPPTPPCRLSTTARRAASHLTRDCPNCWPAFVDVRTRKNATLVLVLVPSRRRHLGRWPRARTSPPHATPFCWTSALWCLCPRCVYPQHRRLSARVVLGLGRRQARTHARTHTLPTHARLSSQLLPLSLLSVLPTCAPTTQAALVSSRHRHGCEHSMCSPMVRPPSP